MMGSQTKGKIAIRRIPLLALVVLVVATAAAVSSWFVIDFAIADRKKWVHPEVNGSVLDAATGQPINSAVIRLVDSEYGGKQTTSDANGHFKLNAVSQRYFWVLPLHGDACFTTKIECSALHFESKTIEVTHGPSGVWDRPSVIPLNFSLTKSE